MFFLCSSSLFGRSCYILWGDHWGSPSHDSVVLRRKWTIFFGFGGSPHDLGHLHLLYNIYKLYIYIYVYVHYIYIYIYVYSLIPALGTAQT